MSQVYNQHKSKANKVRVSVAFNLQDFTMYRSQKPSMYRNQGTKNYRSQKPTKYRNQETTNYKS